MTHEEIAGYCIDLHRRNSEHLGLLPADSMRWYAERGQVFTVRENGALCGYLIAGLKPPWSRIWQACVEYDLRGIGHGRTLVADLTRAALARGCTGITLRCREGMAANTFWRALDFVLVGSVPGGGRRGRPLNVWAKSIAPDLLGDQWLIASSGSSTSSK